MANLTNIQFRISAADKKKFSKVLDEVGLDMPSAFRMFVKKVINSGGIPFAPQKVTENGLTEKEEREVLRRLANAEKHPERLSGPFRTAEEILNHLHSL